VAKCAAFSGSGNSMTGGSAEEGDVILNVNLKTAMYIVTPCILVKH